jgi:hypothetical protein
MLQVGGALLTGGTEKSIEYVKRRKICIGSQQRK